MYGTVLYHTIVLCIIISSLPSNRKDTKKFRYNRNSTVIHVLSELMLDYVPDERQFDLKRKRKKREEYLLHPFLLLLCQVLFGLAFLVLNISRYPVENLKN